MAVNEKLKVTREQLSTFIKDHKTLIQFERLINNMNLLIPEDETNTALSGLSESIISNALISEIQELNKTLIELKNTPSENVNNINELSKKVAEILKIPPAEKHNSYVADYFDFTAGHPTTHRVGRLCWNLTQETLNVHHPDGVLQQVGQEFYLRGYNNTGITITNGELIGIEVSGGSPTGFIAPYIADNSLPIEYVIGVATQDISTGTYGRITMMGAINDIDTTGPGSETWAVGDILYASPTTAGILTNIKPKSPDWCIPIALVSIVNATAGQIYVRPVIEQSLYYGAFSRTTDQAIAAINTAYTLNLDTTETANGIALDGTFPSRINITSAGLYSISATIHISSSSAAAKDFYTWFKTNGSDIRNSAAIFTITDINSSKIISRNDFYILEADDYIEIGYAASSTDVTIDATAATAFAPAAPACLITVEQIQH